MTNSFFWTSTIRCDHAEGPVWDAAQQRIVWVDISAGCLHQYSPSTEHYSARSFDSLLGCVAPVSSGGWVVALQSGLVTIAGDGDEITSLAHPEQGKVGLRYNDGKVDPWGRFWVGSMALDCAEGQGSLWRIAANGQAAMIRSKLTVPNGLAWRRDRAAMYFIDSPTKRVLEFALNSETGEILHERVALNFSDADGYPDGMTIDAEGYLWIAHWDGGCVSRWNPESGVCVQRILLPVRNVTSCTFGGAHFTDLYVTTSAHGLSPEQLAQQPLAGSVFALRTETQGYAADLFD